MCIVSIRNYSYCCDLSHYKTGDELRDSVCRCVSESLVTVGILEPIDSSDWAAPIVPVIKSDKKSVRICCDFRVIVNPVSRLNRYPIPKIEDPFAKIASANGKIFSTIDLIRAYPATASVGRRIAEAMCDQHTQGAILLYEATIWSSIGPWHIPKDHGTPTFVLHSISGVVVLYIDDILVSNRGVRNTPKNCTRFRNPEILLEISGFSLGFQDFT